jgi:hypothetical protein
MPHTSSTAPSQALRSPARHVRRLLLGLLAVALAWTALPPAPATADPWDPDPQDYVHALEGWIENLPANRTDMLRCPELAGGTAGIPEQPFVPPRQPITGNPYADGDATGAPASLPEDVRFRTTQESFNRRYEFAIAEGTIWYRANPEMTGISQPWAPLDVPGCFDGRVIGIAVDDDELIAIDDERWIYTMDNALAHPASFNWTMRWGPPFWTGSGHRLPSGIRDWDWSVLSWLEDRTFRDDAGNDHEVGQGKVSHIWVLDEADRRLTYIDPWLPRDESLEMCAPHRGRFRPEALGASGSTIFVVGPHGDLFTRLYDFDIGGADTFFFSYSYEDQRDARNPAIQLPSPDWIPHTKIPGTITDRISIHKIGSGSFHRELRVEGRHQGRTGYWHKDITEAAWGFTVTDEPLRGSVLANPQTDSSAWALGPSEDRRYVGTHDDARIVVADFHVACTPARLDVRFDDGQTLPLVLHVADGLRQSERARGLDAEPRWRQGTIEVPPEVREQATGPARAFLDELGDDQFIKANLDVTADRMVFRAQGWTLHHDIRDAWLPPR